MMREGTPAGDDGGGALTRRAVLQGAGAAIAVGAVGTTGAGATGLRGRAAAAKPPFDIRDHVAHPELASDCVQCVYDDINRMVILVGDIPFRRLFRTPMSQLVPVLRPRVAQAAGFGLIGDPGRVFGLSNELEQGAPRSTIADFYILSRRHVPRGVRDVLLQLRREGIRIPLPNAGGSDSTVRAEVIRRLLRAAPNFTFEKLYTVPKIHTSRAALEAIGFAKANALLGWGKNDYCCAHRVRGPFNQEDACLPQPDSECYLGGSTNSFCTAISDDCPPERLPPKKR
jgi:hypothetical protein